MSFDNSDVVWTEEEMSINKSVAKLLLDAGFRVSAVARLLDISTSSIYRWGFC